MAWNGLAIKWANRPSTPTAQAYRLATHDLRHFPHPGNAYPAFGGPPAQAAPGNPLDVSLPVLGFATLHSGQPVGVTCDGGYSNNICGDTAAIIDCSW